MTPSPELKEAFEKRFPDPMTEKYGKGFALWCSNCHGESRDKILSFIAEREALARAEERKSIIDWTYNQGCDPGDIVTGWVIDRNELLNFLTPSPNQPE